MLLNFIIHSNNISIYLFITLLSYLWKSPLGYYQGG